MSAIILDGKALAAEIKNKIKEEISGGGLKPGLGVILVGNDPASALYVSLKEKAAAEVGIAVHRVDLPASVASRDVIAQIRAWNADPGINGILVQLPLPSELNPNEIIAEISPAKDVDGFHPKNATGLVSPGIGGAIALLLKTGVDIKDKHCVVVGNSPVFTQSFTDSLRHLGGRAEPTYPDNFDLIKQADVLVVAVGRPGWIKAENIKPGAIIIDVGTNKVADSAATPGKTKTVGDVDPGAAEVASFMTPVPGGVGPVTVAKLLENCVELYRQQNG